MRCSCPGRVTPSLKRHLVSRQFLFGVTNTLSLVAKSLYEQKAVCTLRERGFGCAYLCASKSCRPIVSQHSLITDYLSRANETFHGCSALYALSSFHQANTLSKSTQVCIGDLAGWLQFRCALPLAMCPGPHPSVNHRDSAAGEASTIPGLLFISSPLDPSPPTDCVCLPH